MCSNGRCFVVLPPMCSEKTVIFGRNSCNRDAMEKTQEILYYDGNSASDGKCNGGVEPEVIGSLSVILQKPAAGLWGGDFGANEKNVCIGILWTKDEPDRGNGYLLPTDIVRFTLAAATNASDAIEQIGSLVSLHGADQCKSSFVACDATEVWTISCCGKLWAAQRFTDGCKYFAGDGLSVARTIDKCSDDLGENMKAFGLWDGNGDLDFAACCGASSSNVEFTWFGGDELTKDGSYTLIDMFATLRRTASEDETRSATVSVVAATGISGHWFTATPNPCESVFKPFVFAPKPKISPLTRVMGDSSSTLTLLHKLHAQRKSCAIGDLRKLETSCVEEVTRYFLEHPTPTDELDELMKDCVEAEVKFYR